MGSGDMPYGFCLLAGCRQNLESCVVQILAKRRIRPLVTMGGDGAGAGGRFSVSSVLQPSSKRLSLSRDCWRTSRCCLPLPRTRWKVRPRL